MMALRRKRLVGIVHNFMAAYDASVNTSPTNSSSGGENLLEFWVRDVMKMGRILIHGHRCLAFLGEA
jgi:hypothetical protein